MGKKRILIVDDEEQIQFCISLVLRMKGYETICISDAEKALHTIMQMHYTGQKIDLLICDFLMPKISGEELIDKISAFKLNIPFLVISGYSDRDLIIRLMRKGCRDFVDKPFEPVDLEKRVEMILNDNSLEILEEKRNETMRKIGVNTQRLAHDMNNMLCAAICHANIILDEIDESNPVRKQMQKVVGATERAIEICESILNFKVGDGDQKYEKCDIGQIVREVVSVLQDVISESVVISVKIDEKPLWVQANSNNLKQVVLNIGLNAAQAMPLGGELKIWTKVVDTDDIKRVEISFMDNGHGIAPDKIDEIFKEGYTTRENGNGLGLSMVKKILREHGGEISVQSDLGIGSVFLIKLPMVVTNNPKEECRVE